MSNIADVIKAQWGQYSHWARPGRGGAHRYLETLALLRAGGYRLVGTGAVPPGAEVIYAPTGSIDRGGPGRRVRYYVGRWYRPTGEVAGERA
jgi:hypothetical protein